MQRIKIYELINAERDRQDGKWGAQRSHPPLLWSAILTEECGEVAKAALESEFEGASLQEFKDELVQTAAVAICILEML